MTPAELEERDQIKPFGGCTTLLGQYQTIGAALLEYERRMSRRLYSVLYPSGKLEEQFSVAVSFVGVEVLESFLDDLLDLSIRDEDIFLMRSWAAWQRIGFGVGLGAILLLSGGVVTLLDVGGLALFACAATLSATVLATILLCVPRPKIIRRFGFATLLSHEILRRRGSDGRTNKRSILSISEFLSRREFVSSGRFASTMMLSDDWDLLATSDVQATHGRLIH